MPQQTTASARVIDPVLTEVARGYRNAQFVGRHLFPTVRTGQRAGTVIRFGRESFRQYGTARAPGSNVARVQYGYAGDRYALTDHSLMGVVPVELMEDAAAVPGIDLGRGAIQLVQDSVQLGLEIEQARLARDANSYAVTNKITLAGDDQWSDYANSDPIADLNTAINAVRAQIGLRPNTVVLGAAVWEMLKFHPRLVDRFKYTGRESISTEMLANLIEVERVVIGSAVYVAGQADTLSDVWGKDVVIAYTNTASLAQLGAPSYGYTYELSGYPFVEVPRWDADTRSWLYGYTESRQAQLVGAEAGYLITNAVA